MRKNAKNNKKGFTLIELIVVVAILVALMLMLVPRLTGFTDEATKTANTANARAIYTAIKATETAQNTKLYTTAPDVDLCTGENDTSVNVYKEFWDESPEKTAKVKSLCKYDSAANKVTYGETGKPNTLGTYPVPDSE